MFMYICGIVERQDKYEDIVEDKETAGDCVRMDEGALAIVLYWIES